MAIVGVQEDLRYPDVVWVLLVRICIQLRMPGGDQGEALALLVVYGNVAQLQLLHRVRLYNDLPGVDATVAEGWLDLRVRNDTEVTFQIAISFDQAHITGRVYTARDLGLTYEAINENLVYYRQNGRVYEGVDVVQRAIDTSSGICVSTRRMYRNQCEIGYQLPAGTAVQEKG